MTYVDETQYFRHNKNGLCMKAPPFRLISWKFEMFHSTVLYVNYLNESRTQLKSIIFADDTTLYIKIKPSFGLTNQINGKLNQVETWINAKKLSIYVQKTNYMIMSSRRVTDDIDIKPGGELISRASHHKFLGAIIDDRLKFYGHINLLCNKVSQSIGIMKRVS